MLEVDFLVIPHAQMAALMPQGTNAFCPNGSHLCMWDDQEIYFHHLLKFLKSV